MSAASTSTLNYNLRSRKESRQDETSNSANTSTNAFDSNIADFSCSICYEILIEPVKLECNHELCMICMKKFIENKSFSCPICRKSIKGVYRLKTKVNLNIDENRWTEVKRAFPSEVKNRMNAINLKLTEEKMNRKIIRQIIVSLFFV